MNLIDNSLFFCDRTQMWSFPNGEFYSGYGGESIFRFPGCEFAIEYLNCGRDLKYENTSYYQFWEDFRKFYEKMGKKVVPDFSLQKFTTSWKVPFYSSAEKCGKFFQLMDSMQVDGQKEPIEVFKVCNDVYLIIEGHHRICCNIAFGRKTDVVVKKEIKRVWDLDRVQIEKVAATFKAGGLLGNLYYHPPFWTNERVKLNRESDKRLFPILKDIISLKGNSVLEIGCATGFFSACLNQIPNIEVTALDNDVNFVNIVKVRKELTDQPKDIVLGTVRDINKMFDAILYIDVFFQILERQGLKEAVYQLERVCELAKDRIYFGMGYYPILNEFGTLSDFYRKIFCKWGFTNIEMLHYSYDEVKQYKRTIFVAKKV